MDYVGDVKQFEKEFNEDLAVIAFAVKQYGLPPSLKLSVHSGSDKFSIYAPMRRALKKFDAGRAHQNRRHDLAGRSSSAWRRRAATVWKSRRRFTPTPSSTWTNFARRMPAVIDIDQKKLPARRP